MKWSVIRARPASLALGALVLALCAALVCVGCARKCSGQGTNGPTEGARTRAKPPGALPRAASAAEQDEIDEQPDAHFADAIRGHDFRQAARLIDAAVEEERRKPEVHYARALVALELGDPGRALSEVASLSTAGPAFAERADQVTLRVAKLTRDATVLQHMLREAHGPVSTEDRLLLAEALIEGGQVKSGDATLSAILHTLEQEKAPSTELLARTRRTRAELRRQLGQTTEAALDFRWLALNAVGMEAGVRADQHAEHLDPKNPLTKAERLVRARRLSELGQVPELAEELRRLALAPGPPPEPQALTFAQAWALYASRSDYPKAAELFAQAATQKGEEAVKCLYYQAKALARSGDHESAIAVYRKVSAHGGAYLEPASYEAVRLLHLKGDWAAAISGYERYLRQFPKGAHRTSVDGDLPVVRLALGSYDVARRELAALIRKTDDARERARLLELEGIAASGQRDDKAAVALFGKVIEEQPLTLAALLAQNRLRALGAPIPPLLPPGEGSQAPPLPHLRLPDLAERLHRVGLDEEAEQALKAEEPALKARFGERAPEVLCRLYGHLESAMRRYQVAQTATKRAALYQQPSGDGLWQWECIYPRPYAEVVQREAALRKVPEALVYGVMRQESAFRPRVVSSAQAVGLMQIIPSTARQIGTEIGVTYQPELMNAPAVNVQFGVYYLGKLLGMFAGRPELAAAAYNAGPRALSGWLDSLAVLPVDLFLASIPYEETRTYVQRVMSNYARYAYLAGERLPEVPLELPKGLRAPEGAY